MQRWIMHIDMDAFFASVEELDEPSLRGKPVIVGGGGDRGVVCAASYAARKFGVHSAMPIWQARRLCPHGSFVPTRKWRYGEVSKQVMAVFDDFSPVVEQASVDEAYVDATGLERLFGPVEDMAMALKAAVKERTGLTCSVGLAPVKFLAKIASDVNKPDGLFIVRPHEMDAFLASLPVGRIPGVGKRMLASLQSLGISKVGQIIQYSQGFWEQRYGKAGVALHERASGIDRRQVEPYVAPKSESRENTFAKNTRDMQVLRRWLLAQAEYIGMSLRRHGLTGRTITLKLKYADFSQISRSHSLEEPTNTTHLIFEEAWALLSAVHLKDAVRLIGIGVSNFDDEYEKEKRRAKATQLSLFGTEEIGQSAQTNETGQTSRVGQTRQVNGARQSAQSVQTPQTGAHRPPRPPRPPMDMAKRQRLETTLDALRTRFGSGAVVRGDLLDFEEE